MNSYHSSVFVALLLALMAATSRIRAQPAERDSIDDPVEAHFRAGVEAAKQGRFEEAREQYIEAWKLRKTHDVAANLGGAEFQLGLYRDAAEHLRYALDHLAASKASEIGGRIAHDLDLAKQHVGTLRIHVEPDRAQVTAGGTDLGLAAALPNEIYIDPGIIEVRAELAGHDSETARIAIDAGQTRAVALTLAPHRSPEPESAVPAPAFHPFPPELNHPTERRDLVPVFIGAGVTATALGVGVGFAIDSGAAKSDARAALIAAQARFGRSGACTPERGAGSAECEKLHDLRDRYVRSGNIANGAFIVAGTAALFTAGAYFLWPKTEHATARLMPVLGPHTGLALTGSF